MQKIFVVTINYNSENETETLIDSLKKTEKKGFDLEIIVVDNGSEKKFETKENVIVIRSQTNTGFSGGCNIGIKEALKSAADYIFLINNDTTIEVDTIGQLLKTFETSSKIGVTTPKIYFTKGHEFHKDKYKKNDLGKVLWFAGGYVDWKNIQSVHRGMDEVDYGQYDNIEEIKFTTGCCMMIKKEVLENVGYFDERYFLYYEDADFSERVIKAGYEIYYVPTAIVYHDNAGSTGGSGSNLHDYFLTRNQMLFGLNYAPFRSKIALLRQSLNLLISGREYQKKGVRDFSLKRFGKGTYFDKK